MLLCGVVRAALSASLAGVVQIVIFLLQNSYLSRVQASLPPGAEDEIILIEHLPGRRVHLQDFFWTDAEDAPPWVDSNQGLIFYETRTIRHTVTVYSPNQEEDVPEPTFPGSDQQPPECTTCIEPTPRLDDDEDQSIGVLIGEDPGPRYWLLTVLRAGEAVPPKIELKLARLYRAAFSRQQQRHLGLLATDPRSRRAAKERSFIDKTTTTLPIDEKIIEPPSASKSEELSADSSVPNRIIMKTSEAKPMKMMEVSKFRRTLLPVFNDEEESNNIGSIKTNSVPRSTVSKSKSVEVAMTPDFTKTPTNLESGISSNATFTNSSSNAFDGDSVLSGHATSNFSDAKSVASANVRSRLRFDNSLQGIVQVRMQNTSVLESGATRLIYSVHLGGKPVPAETAARDMALLSPQEVALELGTPVIIQSKPYLKETRPLALSRKRDAWLLVGAAGAGILILIIILVGLILAAKRKRAHSAVAAPPSRSILKKEREYLPTIPGLDNAGFSTSETDARTDGTSQRQTPGTLSRTPITPDTPESLEAGVQEVSSNSDEEAKRKPRVSSPWNVQERPKKTRLGHGRMTRTNAMDPPRTPDSTDTVVDQMETLESLENGYVRQEEATASPHSYLSMPSCKQFPSMRSVEPLSRVLEPVMVRHLDIESPEMTRHDNSRVRSDDKFLTRTLSATKDPGVVGPIVWNLTRPGMSAEGNGTSETDFEPVYMASAGPVGRARRRLHELLEDSFSLFGSRDPRIKEQQPTMRTVATRSPDGFTILSETRGRSAHVSPVATPTTEVKSRPRTSVPRKGMEEDIPETGHLMSSHPRGAWGSRPFSAGPFHRPNLPEVDTTRVLANCELSPEDPAVPLIASIKKELEKFSSQ